MWLKKCPAHTRHLCKGTFILLIRSYAQQASSVHLKIALYWHPYCHHYSFHHPYQQCGAHSVGQSDSQAAFIELSSLPHRHGHNHTLLIPSKFVFHLPSVIFPSCSPRSLPSPLFFTPLHLPSLWEALMSETHHCVEKDR